MPGFNIPKAVISAITECAYGLMAHVMSFQSLSKVSMVLRCHMMMERFFATILKWNVRHGARFWGVDVFILINLAGLILRYWRQNRREYSDRYVFNVYMTYEPNSRTIPSLLNFEAPGPAVAPTRFFEKGSLQPRFRG